MATASQPTSSRGFSICSPRVTDRSSARTPVAEALRLGRGVCQDFAHLFLAACRGIWLPARYVSGYIHRPGEVATHAWCQVWTGSGWIDVDPTRGSFAGDDYIKIAVGRDYSDVPPNRGVWKGRADETIAVSVKVEPIDRVPTDWSDWSAIQSPWSPASWIRSQARRERLKLNPQAGYRQQQGQQQQAGNDPLQPARRVKPLSEGRSREMIVDDGDHPDVDFQWPRSSPLHPVCSRACQYRRLKCSVPFRAGR
jgi:Transglutaminase-like superfamily